MKQTDRIFVTGHNGLVGSAIVRRLQLLGYKNILTCPREVLDLRDRHAVMAYFRDQGPQYVFNAAAHVGGIFANSKYPADFIRDNLEIQTNVIDAAYRSGVKKLQFLGSSCIYPKHAQQPIHERQLLTGPLEETNQWYAIAKIAGIKMAQAYRQQYGFNCICLMPTNLFGIGDNFDLETSHVLPALLRRFHEAKVRGEPSVIVWGSGNPRREFMFVDDLADAAVFLMNHYDSDEIINVGTGEEVTILELATLIQGIVGYNGSIELDASKPDGTPRKLLDISKLLALGWSPSFSLEIGIRKTYEWYCTRLDTQHRHSC